MRKTFACGERVLVKKSKRETFYGTVYSQETYMGKRRIYVKTSTGCGVAYDARYVHKIR